MEIQVSVARINSTQPKVPVEKPHNFSSNELILEENFSSNVEIIEELLGQGFFVPLYESVFD